MDHYREWKWGEREVTFNKDSRRLCALLRCEKKTKEVTLSSKTWLRFHLFYTSSCHSWDIETMLYLKCSMQRHVSHLQTRLHISTGQLFVTGKITLPQRYIKLVTSFTAWCRLLHDHLRFHVTGKWMALYCISFPGTSRCRSCRCCFCQWSVRQWLMFTASRLTSEGQLWTTVI